MPKRIQMSRQHPWQIEPKAIVVDRRSRWGNPFPVADWGLDLSLALLANTVQGMWNPSTLGQDKTEEQFAAAYAAHTAWLERIGGHPLDLIVHELGGRDLACWCPLDQPCHADVLLELANLDPVSPAALPAALIAASS